MPTFAQWWTNLASDYLSVFSVGLPVRYITVSYLIVSSSLLDRYSYDITGPTYDYWTHNKKKTIRSSHFLVLNMV